MKITILEEIFDWLEKNTKNFTYIKDRKVECGENYHPDVYLATDIERVYSLIQRQLSNVESGFITKEQLPMAIWFNIFNDHILINGNKRLAWLLYKWFDFQNNWGDHKEENILLVLINSDYNDLAKEMKYLEDK